MGFSISGSAAIIFIGFLVAAGLAIPTFTGTFADVSKSQSEQIDRGVDTLNTELDIERAEYNQTTDVLTVEARNTGSTTLTKSDTSLLIDDVLITSVDRGIVNANSETDLWMSDDLLRFTVTDVSTNGNIDTTELDRGKVVSENGVDDVAVTIEVVS